VIGADIAVLLHPVSAGAAALVGWLAEPGARCVDHRSRWLHRGEPADPSTFYQPDVLPLTEQVSGSEFVFALSTCWVRSAAAARFSECWRLPADRGDGGTDRVNDAAAVVAGRMRDIEATHGR